MDVSEYLSVKEIDNFERVTDKKNNSNYVINTT